MEYTVDEIRQFTAEEDVKFLRLAFCDIFGSQKNISILPDELDRAFSYGIASRFHRMDGISSIRLNISYQG